MSTSPIIPSPRKLETFSTTLKEEYTKYSVVGAGIEWHEAALDTNGDFQRIGRRFYAERQIFSDDPAYSAVFIGLGNSIAIGEEKYLIHVLQDNVKPSTVRNLDEMFSVLRSQPYRFTACFMPLDYYADYGSPRGFISEDPNRFVSLSTQRPFPIFWSNKYVDYKQFFFVSEGSLDWLVKLDPQTRERLRIKVEYNESVQKFDVRCQTIAFLKLIRPDSILSFVLAEPPRHPIDMG